LPIGGHEPETRSDSSGQLVRPSNDLRAAREFFHTVGDTGSQLEYRLAQLTVFRNVVLNTTEIRLAPATLRLGPFLLAIDLSQSQTFRCLI
jgi:hypothetical protein